MITYTKHEISQQNDPRWEAWKQIYNISFPVNEKVKEEYFLSIMDQKSRDEGFHKHILSYNFNNNSNIEGIAYYEVFQELKTAFLWYIATDVAVRGRGFGSYIYQDLCQSLRDSGINMLVFEVEIPSTSEDTLVSNHLMARRRVEWYLRQGAQILEGIEYYQTVDAEIEPIKMWILVHLFSQLDVDQVFATCSDILGESFSKTGTLYLRSASS